MGGGRILDVTRKPVHCPKCGQDSEIWPIIYKTGDMTETEFFLKYRKSAIMGGDNIPRRPPIWGCSCCSTRFRKVNPDGTDADVKPTLLKNVRPASLLKITWESKGLTESIGTDVRRVFYHVEIETELGEKEMLRIWATNRQDAEDAARDIVERCDLGLKGTECKALKVIELQ